MPEIIRSVKCASCGKLHAKTSGYLVITAASVTEHKDELNESYNYKKKEPEQISVKDVVVCDNDCLRTLLALKGFQ